MGGPLCHQNEHCQVGEEPLEVGVVTGQDRSLEKREVWREPLWGVGAAGPQEVGRWAAGCPVSLNPHVFPVDPRTAVGRGVRPSSLERRTSRHLALAGAGQGLSLGLSLIHHPLSGRVPSLRGPPVPPCDTWAGNDSKE